MTRYSRSVIPGRSSNAAADVDSLVFGNKSEDRAVDRPNVRGRREVAANDADDNSVDEIPAVEVSTLIERASSDRRKGGKRRESDFAPLPGEGRGYREHSEGGKRGPILLVGALVIVAVFGVVVWSAYRDGVRPEDSAATQLADAGPFKSKPVEAVKSTAAEATVFDQVEAPAKPLAAPAPEVREQVVPPAATAPAPAAKVAAPTAQAKPAAPQAAKPAPTVETKTAARTATAPPPTAAAPVAVAMQTKAVIPAPVAVSKPADAPIQLAGAAAAAPAIAAGGKFAVQIAAASSEEGASAEWNRHAKKAPDLFAAAEKVIVQADVNGRTVYRVRAGSFATAADADSFCNAFKARGGECFRVAK